ncbi:MAG: molybdopterin oxidoreductase, iron-sulfur binding subunit [Acidobacteria bacterium]|nr:molybdopterin oxidoreductase, iron-sulfur binding subunit [Acidobacteriota bacterium]
MPSKDNKQNFASLRSEILAQSGKQYWRSVEEYVDAPEFAEFVKSEYPSQADQWDNSLSRRNFIKVMGASLALAGLSGCVIQPSEKIVPYVRQNEELLPGKPLFFATAMSLGGIANGLLAKSYDGRPIKIEGNPEHPGTLGSTDVWSQASILNMYDPDRSQEITFRGTPATWQTFMTQVRGAIEANRADGGAGVRFLTETITSPTLVAQFSQIARELPNSKWVQYEPINNDNAMTGARLAFGTPVHTVYKFDLADKIVTLDKDLFSDFNVRYMKDFAKKRTFSQEKQEINRLYAVETTLTLTGAKADHRLAVKPSQVSEVAKALATALGVGGAAPVGLPAEATNWIAAMARDLQASRGRSIVVPGESQSPVVHALAHAINGALGNVGQTVIYTDPLSPASDRPQVEQLRELIADIDGGRVKMLVILGANPVYNTPVDLKLNPDRLNKVPLRVHLGQYIDETAEHCHWHVSEKHYLETWGDARAYDGTVSIVQPLIEPLYGSKSIHEVVQVFLRENFDKTDYDIIREFWQTQNLNASAPRPVAAATSGAANGNAAQNATGGRTPGNAAVNSQNAAGQFAPAPSGNQPGPTNQSPQPSAATVNQTAQNAGAQGAPAPTQTGTATTNNAGGNFEDAWRRVVHDGFVPNSAAAPRTVAVNPAFLSQPDVKPANTGELEISIRKDPSVYDGRFANNGWLQELPKPLTKTTWENVAFVSPRTAERLGLNQNKEENNYVGGEEGTSFVNTKGGNLFSDLVRLDYQGTEIQKDVPIWIAPGQPDDVVTIFMGYGRTRAGRVGTGLGYNVFDVRRSDAMNYGTGKIAKTGAQTTIASTQTHFNMEERDIIRVADIEVFKQHPEKWQQPEHYDESMYPRFEYNGNKWGMTIDMNNCVGCNACVIACQSENNIPVVGKEQIERSREMHWLRIDAYFTGDDVNNPKGPHFQPMLCQHCEQAPCEPVCPVHATVHSAEGLNDMVYNRCVGTRYCSNNCPYKVRRFNFLLYQDWDTPQYKLMRNPEVTVRSRGVMEKCTFCTQRIAAARIEAEKDGRDVRDGEILTACQAACPTDVFSFGDLNDPNSVVAKQKKDPRNYILLNELNTQPRTTYLATLKNQNQEMPDYKALQIPKNHAPETADEGKGEPTESGH